jgi:hypothetical protein
MTAPIDATPAGPSGLAGTAVPFAIADVIAAAAGGPAIVEDPSFRVLGYSAFVGQMDRGRAEAILGRRIPLAWLEHLTATGSLATLRTSTDVVDLRDGPWEARRRLITAFRAGSRVLGFAWVAEGAQPLGADAAIALRRAVDDATPDLLRHLEQIDAAEEHAFREVSALLDGLPGAPAVADRLGLERGGRFVVLAVSSPGSDPDGRVPRLVEHLRLCLDSFRRQAALTPYAGGAAAVVALAADDAPEAGARLGNETLRLSGRGPLHPLRVAVSAVGTGIASIPRLRDQALAAAATLGRETGGCVTYDDVEAQVLVGRMVASLSPDAGLSGLDRLREADRGSGVLERTLRAFLASCGSASAAARDLGVHVTTVRHRLDRVATVSGLRLDSPDVRIACEVLLRASDTHSDQQSSAAALTPSDSAGRVIAPLR